MQAYLIKMKEVKAKEKPFAFLMKYGLAVA
jgi:hypothetical protein